MGLDSGHPQLCFFPFYGIDDPKSCLHTTTLLSPDIRTICHFAQTEYKQGDPNRGSTMFENVLTTYPHRLDLWAVYLDKTIALNDHQQSR